MRLSADWMILADERILELLRDDGEMIPSQIARDERIDWGNQHVQNRCTALAEAGLIRNLGRGVYTLTEEGAAYLAEDLDARELPKPDSLK